MTEGGAGVLSCGLARMSLRDGLGRLSFLNRKALYVTPSLDLIKAKLGHPSHAIKFGSRPHCWRKACGGISGGVYDT